MKYFNTENKITLTLNRDLSKHIKRGNPWVFSDALKPCEKGVSGAIATLKNGKSEVIARGFYCPKINLTFRVITIGEEKLNDELIEKRLNRCFENKIHLYKENFNTSFRLINGEGDELPGMICDIYDSLAVLKLDGNAAHQFWNTKAVAQFLVDQKYVSINCVYLKKKNNVEEKGNILVGKCDNLTALNFLENKIFFQTNIIDAAKTGFFIDQRENRQFVKMIAKNKSVLNLFGYTGGFSVYAGMGEAKEVTTVDISKNAISASMINWTLNNLSPKNHEAVCDDAFLYVKKSYEEKKSWDIVITDPPSFAPNQKSVENAKNAYIEIFKDSAKLVKDEGLLIVSSCSGHISFEQFFELCLESLSQARRRGKVIVIKGQPEDHPFPSQLSEMRYLKFIVFQLFKS